MPFALILTQVASPVVRYDHYYTLRCQEVTGVHDIGPILIGTAIEIYYHWIWSSAITLIRENYKVIW